MGKALHSRLWSSVDAVFFVVDVSQREEDFCENYYQKNPLGNEVLQADCSCFENEEKQDGGQECQNALWEWEWVRIRWISGVTKNTGSWNKRQITTAFYLHWRNKFLVWWQKNWSVHVWRSSKVLKLSANKEGDHIFF